jgi:DNA-binding NarL/FixJ family response regulator
VEAFADAFRSGRPFDAVITDLTVPGGMGGEEAVRRMQEIDPGVRAIVSSGYSNNPVMSHYRDYGFRGVVIKPYTVEQLTAAVHDVLKEQGAASESASP